jgi:peptidyl-prolyl cis-trans isomerase C
MKVFALSVLCLGCALAQIAAPQAPPNAIAAPPAPPKPAALPDIPDKKPVVAFDDGTELTMGELRGLLTNLDPQQLQGAVADIHGFLDQWAMFHKLAQMALADKLDQESPVKEQLLFARTNVLAQAEVQRQSNPNAIDGVEIDQYYAAHKDKYRQVKTDAINIAFSNSAASQAGSDGKKILSEAEAKAKITGLLEQIRKGADFRKLAKENSDGETSRAKDGYFAILSPADNIPDAIRSAVFALKAGETTGVIWQANGFYIFRAEEINFKPLSEVRDQIYDAIKAERFQKWMAGIRSSTKAKILDPALTGGK